MADCNSTGNKLHFLKNCSVILRTVHDYMIIIWRLLDPNEICVKFWEHKISLKQSLVYGTVDLFLHHLINFNLLSQSAPTLIRPWYLQITCHVQTTEIIDHWIDYCADKFPVLLFNRKQRWRIILLSPFCYLSHFKVNRSTKNCATRQRFSNLGLMFISLT